MVNEKRVRQKLPEILVDGPLTKKVNLNQYQRIRYKIRRIERKNEGFLRRKLRKLNDFLQEIQDDLESYDIKIE